MKWQENGCALALASLLLLLPAHALADVDVEVRSGDKAKGTFDPAAEAETFRVTVAAGAKLVVKAAGKKGVSAHLEVFGTGDVPLATGVEAGAKSTLTFTAPQTAQYRVVATSRGGAASGAYGIALSWSSPAKVTSTQTLGAGTSVLAFGADAGSSAKVQVKAAKGSGALPRIVRVTGPDFTADLNIGGSSASAKAGPVPLGAAGTYQVEVNDGGAAGGDAVITVTLSKPKSKPRTLDLTSKAIGGGGDDFAIGALVGAEGGVVAVPDLGGSGGLDDISGSAVDIPPGALPSGGVIFIGTAPTLDPKGDVAPVGATVLMGPEGTKFGTKGDPVPVTVTIPIEPSLLGADTSDVKIYTRDASGKVTVVPGPYTFDLVGGTVSFPTPHFSSFVAARPQEDEPQPGAIFLTQVTGLTAPRDLVFDVTSTDPELFYYYAEGETIRAISVSGTGMYTTALFAGGGAQTADGTDRLSFDFPGIIQAIESDSQFVYAATATQIFRISAAGQVFRLLGDGTAADQGDMGPAVAARMRNCTDLLARADGFLLVVDQDAARVRIIDTSDNIDAFAGTGTSAAGVDGPVATMSPLDAPGAIAYDIGLQNAYLAERGRVRRIDPTGAIATVSGDPNGATGCQGGTGTGARYTRLSAIAFTFDPTNGQQALFLGDAGCDVIFRYHVSDGASEIVAGTPNMPGFTADSQGVARVDDPRGFFAFSSNFLGFLDAGNGRLRQLVIQQAP